MPCLLNLNITGDVHEVQQKFIYSVPTTFLVQGCGWLEPILAVVGREAGYTLDWLPFNLRPDTQRRTTLHQHTHIYAT